MSDAQLSAFCDITGANPEQAASYMQIADGNLEVAVGLFMENGGIDLSTATQERASSQALERQTSTTASAAGDFVPNSVGSVRPISGDSGDVRAAIAPRRQTLLGGDDGGGYYHGPVVNIPGYEDQLRILGHSIQPQTRSHEMNPFASFHEEDNDEISIPSDTEGDNQAMASPGRDRRNRLAELFAPPADIMFTGTFDQAREHAKKNQRWIIVTLHDPTEFPCQVLNRDLWKDKQVKDVVRESFIFLQLHTSSHQGQQYRTFYPVDSLPHIAIIDPRTGERVKIWHTAVSVADFLVEVMDFLDANNLKSTKSVKKQKSSTEMSESEQLEAAIAASLAASRSAAASAAVPETAISSSSSSTPQSQAVDSAKHISPVAKLAAKERSDLPAGTPTAMIQFRLPSGQKLVKKFAKNDKVLVVFQHLKAVAAAELEGKPFELVFMREPLSKSLDKSLDEMKLSGAALIVDFSE